MSIIAIANAKGGTGKTSASLNIIGEMKPQQVVDKDVTGGISVLNNFRDDNKKLPIVDADTVEELISHFQKGDEKNWLTIVDCGGFDSNLNRVALASADLIVVPSNEDPTELIGLRAFDDILAKISEEIGRHITAHVFLCKVNPNSRRFPEMDGLMENARHLKLLSSVIPRRKEYIANQFRGLGVTELVATASSQAGKELKALCNELSEIIERQSE